MPNSYKITVINNTGGPQDYAFFSATPVVSGGVSGPIWSNVLKSAGHTPNGAQASFEVLTTHYATCGSFEGSPEHGDKVTISKSVPINLGSKAGGNVTPGSSVALTVYDQTSCDLGPLPPRARASSVTSSWTRPASRKTDSPCKTPTRVSPPHSQNYYVAFVS
ncbi:uncharacterized protein PG986_000039 [Apiospora aurea]|uniref:Uncharacterized protein n=1 Tax=Apiospora aurea TaxID=335848 RepID=A0ABR1QTA7_9PEZI